MPPKPMKTNRTKHQDKKANINATPKKSDITNLASVASDVPPEFVHNTEIPSPNNTRVSLGATYGYMENSQFEAPNPLTQENDILKAYNNHMTSKTPESLSLLISKVEIFLSQMIDTQGFPQIERTKNTNHLREAIIRLGSILIKYPQTNSKALQAFLDNPTFTESTFDTNHLPAIRNRTIEVITSLTNMYYCVQNIDDIVDNINVNKELFKFALETAIRCQLQQTHDELQKDPGLLPSAQPLSKALLIIAAAIMTVILATSILSLAGLSLPALLLSYASTLQSLTLIHQAITAMTSLIALTGIQATAGQAAAGLGLLTASTFTLFAAATRTNTLAEDSILAINDIERAFQSKIIASTEL